MGRSQVAELRTSAALCVIDSAGKVTASKSFALSGQLKFGLTALTSYAGSRLLATGVVISTVAGIERATGVLVICLDADLNLIWSRSIRATFDPLNDGEYAMNGLTTDQDGRIFLSFHNNEDFTLVKRPVIFVSLNSSGDLIWSKAIPDKMIWDSQLHLNQNLPDAFSVAGKVFFLGQSQTDTVINAQRIARYGFTGLSFSAENGEVVKASRSFIPSTIMNIGEVGTPASGIQSWFGEKFAYAAGELIRRNATDYPEMNLIAFDTDTSLSVTNLKRIRGFTSAYAFPRFCFNSRGDFAVVSTTSYNTVSVFNARGELVLNRKIESGILNQPFIRSMRFLDNQDYLRLTVIDQGSPAFDMLIVDLPVTGSSDIYSCLGGQGELLAKDTVVMETRSLAVSTIDNVAAIQPITMLSADIVLQETEYCEVKSDCRQLTIRGASQGCVGKEMRFDALKSVDCSRQIVWGLNNIPASQIASTDSSITLSFQQPWSGYVKVSLQGCELSDSVYVEVNSGEARPELGSDQLWCGNDILLNAGNEFMSYEWQDGSDNAQFLVTGPGKYFVTVTDHCGQTYSDTIFVSSEKPGLLFTSDTVLCPRQEIRLIAKAGYQDYKWEPEYRLRNVSENEVMVSPDKDMQYVVTADAGQGCFVSDTISLRVIDCTAALFVPSGFTPNGDGKNDVLVPVVRGEVMQYEFAVYNRVGQLVYRSKTPGTGWTGFIGDKLQPADVYVWMCKVQWAGSGVEIRKGSFVLIR